MQLLALELEKTAKIARDAIGETVDYTIVTVVLFSLHTGFYCRDS